MASALRAGQHDCAGQRDAVGPQGRSHDQVAPALRQSRNLPGNLTRFRSQEIPGKTTFQDCARKVRRRRTFGHSHSIAPRNGTHYTPAFWTPELFSSPSPAATIAPAMFCMSAIHVHHFTSAVGAFHVRHFVSDVGAIHAVRLRRKVVPNEWKNRFNFRGATGADAGCRTSSLRRSPSACYGRTPAFLSLRALAGQRPIMTRRRRPRSTRGRRGCAPGPGASPPGHRRPRRPTAWPLGPDLPTAPLPYRATGRAM